MAKMIKIKEADFIGVVQDLCRKNIQRDAKICKRCPPRKRVIRIMKERGWKLRKSTTRNKQHGGKNGKTG